MTSLVVYLLIFVGVTLALYQFYAIYDYQNFGDDEQRDESASAPLRELLASAREYSRTGEDEAFLKALRQVFGDSLDRRIAEAAFCGNPPALRPEPLVRRRHRIRLNGSIRIEALPGWITRPPQVDIRGFLLMLISANCLLVLFLGGLSIYTLGYQIQVPTLAWTNQAWILMVLIYLLIAVTWLVSRFDLYMHDLYQIGQLNRHLSAD
ncbi:hypothetical protein [Halomonas huangheensis]|uniref:Uncharacterized protein n=1 Tax=Halomonas huangheensis TaxID=1178482 RepID=W1N897_9GAMM|nr:hypothetical protein [Halomonas huangheensis]ALM53232.1 hypothetical protein AR456_13790 [Halomonas huangheensis]ERL51401.1 hypothetical protein BJB45_13360 [Halomonas huangheensis]